MGRKEKSMYLNIEAERIRNGLSRDKLSSELGISLRTYNNWINGFTAIPSTALKKMSTLFKVEIGYLLVEKACNPSNEKAIG